HTEIVERLQQHAENGVYTMIVSGAFTPVLETAVAHLPVDKIIGTDVPFTNDTYESKSPIYHIQSIRKKVVVQDCMHGKTVGGKKSDDDGDSYADVPVLSLVGNPVGVKREEKLRHIAKRKQWEIIE